MQDHTAEVIAYGYGLDQVRVCITTFAYAVLLMLYNDKDSTRFNKSTVFPWKIIMARSLT